MTPRYFYRDPLEASYMYRHYGMAFFSEPMDYFLGGDQVLWCGELGCLSTRNTVAPYEGKCYIRPDSEHIIAPIIGDKLGDERGRTFFVVSTPSHIPRRADITLEFAEELFLSGVAWVEQRTGRSFFSPERENV